MQTALPVLVALTYPGDRTPIGKTRIGLPGVFNSENRVSVLLPLLTIFTTSLANLAFLGPQTTKVMRLRKHQGKLTFLCSTVQLGL